MIENMLNKARCAFYALPLTVSRSLQKREGDDLTVRVEHWNTRMFLVDPLRVNFQLENPSLKRHGSTRLDRDVGKSEASKRTTDVAKAPQLVSI